MSKDTDSDIRDFVIERDRALTTLDIDWARRQARGAPPSDEVILISMHKARLGVISLPEPLKEESRQWLRARGFKTLDGGQP